MKNLIVLTFLIVIHSQHSIAQEPQAALLGSWEGPMTLSRNDMQLAITFTLVDGQLQAQLISAGLGIYGMPADSLSYSGSKLHAIFEKLDAEFTGRVRFNEDSEGIIRIDGDWFQTAEMVPVTLFPVNEPSF